MSKDREYAARLLLAWLNERYSRAFALEPGDGEVWDAVDGGDRLALFVAPLFEPNEAWDGLRGELEVRLDQARPGSYLLWLPPGSALPDEEPELSEFVRRVVLGASRLASGRSGEVRLPAKLMLGKVRDEGGYASVTGGLGRYWTEIAQRLQGSFYLDSRGLNRFTRDEQERAQLYDHIGMLSQGLQSGDAVEFEHEDAWTVQRLPRGAAAQGMTDGWAITGCPPGFDPNDGAQLRRVLRRRLAAAADALKDRRDTIRTVVLVGAYDYMAGETAGPAMRGFDPSLTLPFDIIALVSDAEVKPLLLSRSLNLADASVRQ